jgi:hypothetical protein
MAFSGTDRRSSVGYSGTQLTSAGRPVLPQQPSPALLIVCACAS